MPVRRVFKPKKQAPPRHLVLDLETVTDPDLKDQEHDKAGKSRFPPPPAHRVVCAGFALLDDYLVQAWGVLDGGAHCDERDILRRVVSVIQSERPTIVTMNGHGFDGPVVAARCFKHGVPFPWYYATKAPRYRYDVSAHLDLMDYLADHDGRAKAALHVWSRLLGMPGKEEVSGTDVSILWASGQRAAIADYCMTDIFRTASVLLRYALLRGLLSLAEYQVRASALLDYAEADVRTAGLAYGTKRSVFLLDPSLDERVAAE